MMRNIKKSKWLRFILPLSTYYKLKYGIRNPVLVIVDILILLIPIPLLSVGIICMINYYLNDLEDETGLQNK